MVAKKQYPDPQGGKRPRPAWTYRAARRNAVLRPRGEGRVKQVWGVKHRLPGNYQTLTQHPAKP